jgi:hypothetical protein
MTWVRVRPFGKYVVRIVSRYLVLPTRVMRVVVTVLTARRLCGPILTLTCGADVIVVAAIASLVGTTNASAPIINDKTSIFFISFLLLFPIFQCRIRGKSIRQICDAETA